MEEFPMSKLVLSNALMNVVFALVMVLLNTWALQNQLEETFVTLALFYGLVIIVANGLLVWVVARNRA